MPPSASRWTAAENSLKYNLSSTSSDSATSVGAGGVGGDIFYGVFLGGNRVAYITGDAPWATAGGQSHISSWSNLVHNSVWIQTGLDLSTATFASYAGDPPAGGSKPSPFFPRKAFGGMPYWKYPESAILLDDRLLVTGMHAIPDALSTAGVPSEFGFHPHGPWGLLCFNISSTPDNWRMVEIDIGMPRDDSYLATWAATMVSGIVDGGDSWLYFYCQGRFGVSRSLYVCRFPRSDVKKGKMRHPQWWNGTGWAYDDPSDPIRVNILEFPMESDQPGSVHKRPDGLYQYTCIPQLMSGDDTRVGYSVSAQPQGPFSTWTQIFDIPRTEPAQSITGNAATNTFTCAAHGFQSSAFTGYTPVWLTGLTGGAGLLQQHQYYVVNATTNTFQVSATKAGAPVDFTTNVTSGNVAALGFFYGSYVLPNQTWSGKATADQAILYSSNKQDTTLFGRAQLYWPQILKVTGI